MAVLITGGYGHIGSWAAYLMAKALFLAGHASVIIDATNISEKRRAEWEKRFSGYLVEIKRFNASKEECIQRAKESGRLDLIPVIERMAANEEPNPNHSS